MTQIEAPPVESINQDFVAAHEEVDAHFVNAIERSTTSISEGELAVRAAHKAVDQAIQQRWDNLGTDNQILK